MLPSNLCKMLKKSIIILAWLTVHVQSDAPTPAPPPPAQPPSVPGPPSTPVPGCPNAGPPANPDKPSIKLDEFDAFKDADRLCDVITGPFYKKDPKKITKLLCHRNWDERNQIQQTFPQKCDNRVLIDKIKSITFMLPECRDLMRILLTPPVEIYKQAIEEEKTKNNKDDVITRIICSSNNQEKKVLAQNYPDLQKVLEDYASKGGEGYKQLLLGACLKQRKETPDPSVTPQCIESAANELICKNGPEFVAKLKEIIGKYGDPELKQIFVKYTQLQQDTHIADKVEKSFEGKEMEAYLVFVRSIENKYHFYAKTLNHCIKGGETCSDLDCVNRIVAIRCEIDLGNIADNYKSTYNKKFMDDFKNSVHIDYQYFEAISKLFGEYE